ncbi:MAG: methyltransferase domain-containing protein [Fimbriimonadaceae bacterium]
MESSSDMWREFFDRHAPHYLKNPFAQATIAEVDFIIELFSPLPKSTVLDLGCGVGRHSIELARRGFHVTGVDISPGMLDQARIGAEKANVAVLDRPVWTLDEIPSGSVHFIEGDAVSFSSEGFLFDLALCLCEGGFGLIEHAEDPVTHDLGILTSAFKCLRPNGGFLLTALNGYATIRHMKDEDVEAGAFDPVSMVARYQNELTLPEGNQTLHIHERLFIPPELVALLRHAGFEVLHLWGGTAGEWGQRNLKLDEVEMMAVCRRP